MGEGRGAAIRVLHVEDPGAEEPLAGRLEGHGGRFEVRTRPTASAGLAALEEGAPVDCVVGCHHPPRIDGLALLRAVREAHPRLPFVLVATDGSEALAREAFTAGVTDYLPVRAVADGSRDLASCVATAVEVTASRRAAGESDRMLSTLISNLPGLVYRCRNQRGWPMTFVSDGCEDLTGYPAAALESDEVSWGRDLMVAQDRDRAWVQVQQAVASGDPYQLTYRIRTADGDERWVWERGTCVRDDGDGGELLEGFITDITARKQRERELQDQQEFVQSLLDALGDPFYLLSPDGDLVRWNDRVTAVTGYDDAALREMDGADLVAPDDRQRLRDAVAAVCEGDIATVELDVLTSEGECLPFELRAAQVTDAAGEFVGVVGVARDVSERVARERELEQYRTLVENVGDPMYVLDAEGYLRMVNNATADHLGYEKAALEGLHASELMREADVREGTRHIAELLESETETWRTWEMCSVHADGSLTHTENRIAVLTDEEGTFVGSVGVLRDISDRVDRERELERYETIIQAVGDPVYVADADGTLTFANEAFESLTGYPVDELVGSHIARLVAEEDVERGRECIREMLSDDSAVENGRIESTLTTRAGEEIQTELHIALLPFDDGQFRGTAGIIRDIRDRKAREDRLAEFASVVSHDLRSPLSVIRGRTELARETGEPDHLEVVADAAERMDRLVEDLLTLARQGETVGATREVAIAEVAETAWRTVETPTADLVVGAPGRVEADEARLLELFENLFRNAVDHAGPDVTVTVDRSRDGFFVADDGDGIPEDRREDVFEHGYTTSQGGTGFGLSIVASIATAHDWSVCVTESESGGARFEVAT